MSFPDRKSVWLEEFAWMAKRDEEVAIDGSSTVTTLGKTDSVMERGDTGYGIRCNQDSLD
jgi:hypothetical protein